MKRLILLLVLMGCANSDGNDIGREYLGVKYVIDPLGEEVVPDIDPLIRTDAFDCTTFVETVIANADLENLNAIRYKDGKIGFINRNHFIESDWLPNNADKVRNISDKYAVTDIHTVTIDKQGWLKKVHGIDANIPKKTVKLRYIPYKNLGVIKTDKPLIVLFITRKTGTADAIGTDLAVTHMGFLLPDGTLRHASSQYGYVTDADFYEYAGRKAADSDNIGIMLLEIKQVDTK